MVERNPCNCNESGLVAGLIVLVILLILSLIVNSVFLYKYFKKRGAIEDRLKNLENNNKGTVGKTRTLQKYEPSQAHELDDHRYSSLKPQNSEDQYEYIDANEVVISKNDSKTDNSGYLVPDSMPPKPPSKKTRRSMPRSKPPAIPRVKNVEVTE